MDTFINKTAVITGAASGIGQALALKCGKEGMQVALADIEAEPLARVATELQELGVKTISVLTDVSKEEALKKLCQTTLEAFGSVELLFNNAGVAGPIGPIWSVPADKLRWLFETNLIGIINGVRVFVPQMLAQQTDCHIINTAAMSGFFTYPYFSPYQISKHAVVALSEGLYHDLALKRSKIKVSVLCPGWVKTNIVSSERNYKAQQTLSDLEGLTQEDYEWLLSFGKQVKKGMSADQIADVTLDAIRAGKFYILTHPEMKKPIQERLQAIIDEREPAQFEL